MNFSSNSVAFVEGTTAAAAKSVTINTGGVAVGNINSGTLNVAGEIAVGAAGTPGSFSLNYGTVSANKLSIGSSGTYSDTSYGILNLTGSDPTIQMAGGITVTVNSQIVGTNGLNKGGLGTLVLTGNNSYSGGTTISIGTLQVGNGGNSGNLGDGDVANNGTLAFNRADTITVSNSISGTGNLIQEGNGTTILAADNTYSGGTSISNGVLQIGDGGAAGSLGSGNVSMTNNSLLVFDRSDSVVVSNSISGAGNLSQIGSGTTILTANNPYTGGTTITNGALQVGDGGTTGSLGSGNVTNNSALAFDRSDTITVSNLISGTGSLSQLGSGTMILTADNTYSGVTTISNGTLQVGNGGGTGLLGTNAIYDYGSLVYDLTNSKAVNNVISGTGSLVQAGQGTNSILTLTATNTYSGGTSIQNGGAISVANGWALGTGDVNVDNGTLEASTTSATNKTIIQVGGNYTQSANGTLQLSIGGTVSDAGTNEYDQLNVAGKANLNGTLQLNGANGYVPEHNDEQTLVTADGGVTGTFSSVSNEISHSALLNPQLSYGTNDVLLQWIQLSFASYLKTNGLTLTRNQLAVARGLDSIANSTATNDVKLINYLDYLNNLTNDLPAAFKQISPDQLTSMLVAALVVMDSQGNEFLKRANELHSDYAAMYNAKWRSIIKPSSTGTFNNYINRTWNFYGEIPANFASVHSDQNADGYNISGAGLMVGADTQLNQQLYVGGSLGYANSSAGLDNGGSMDMNSFNGMVYGTWFNQGWHFEGMIGGEINIYDTDRVSVGGDAKGSAVGVGYTGLLGGGYDWELGPWKLGPQLSMQYMSAYISGFTESGSLAPLQILSQSDDALHSQLGVNVRYRYLVGRWTYVNPEVFFGWRHDFYGGSLPLTAKFASGAGDPFTVYSPELGSDSIVSSLGLSIQWNPAFNSFINLTMDLGRSGYDSESLNVGVCFSF